MLLITKSARKLKSPLFSYKHVGPVLSAQAQVLRKKRSFRASGGRGVD